MIKETEKELPSSDSSMGVYSLLPFANRTRVDDDGIAVGDAAECGMKDHPEMNSGYRQGRLAGCSA